MMDIAYTLLLFGILLGGAVVVLTIGALLPVVTALAVWAFARRGVLAFLERVSK